MVAMAIPTTIQTASLGIPDTLFLMVLALVVFGPRRLPEIGRKIGKLMYEFRKISNDFKFQMEEELRVSEEAERQKKLAATASQVTLDVPPHPVSAEPALELTAGSETHAPGIFAGPEENLHDGESPDAETHVSAGPPEDGLAVEPAVDGEAVPSNGPVIRPPSTGDPVLAQRPFRGRVQSEPAAETMASFDASAEPVTESGDAANHVVETPVVVNDEGRVGTEVQPGVKESGVAVESERHTHHA
jgi:sec-independent protein translocase protein TatB